MAQTIARASRAAHNKMHRASTKLLLLASRAPSCTAAPLRPQEPPAPSIVFDDDDYDDEENVWCPLDECEIPPEASSLESSLRESRPPGQGLETAREGLAGPRPQAARQAC